MLGNLELVSIVKKRKRVARGGSRGQKSGRGHNGQLSRPGGRSEVRLAFEGGQKSLVLRIPRRGFTSMCKPKLELADLASIAEHFNNGDMVDAAAMIDKGIIKGKRKHKIKVLGKCQLDKALTLAVDYISSGAKMAVETAGGKVILAEESL